MISNEKKLGALKLQSNNIQLNFPRPEKHSNAAERRHSSKRSQVNKTES